MKTGTLRKSDLKIPSCSPVESYASLLKFLNAPQLLMSASILLLLVHHAEVHEGMSTAQ